ncbi:MAG: FAD-dependent oxidoreductase [Peptostreptococcaceae bacterium]|nr:FAD-dependent oxidoreductase [Peptostreptococcaceae bacterium]
MRRLKSLVATCVAMLIGASSIVPSYAQNINANQRIKYSYRSSILNTSDEPKKTNYDVVVFGSDPEGVAAAYSAGRQGLNVLLMDFNRDRVGGLYTLGWLNMIDFNYAPGQEEWYANVYKDNFLNHGVFERFYNLIGNKKAFDVTDAQKAFEKLLAQANVEVVLTSDDNVQYSYVPSDKMSNIIINGKTSPKTISAKVVIDATPNADIAVQAGAKFYEGKEDIGLKGKYQSATLVYKIKGVNWEKVRQTLQSDGDPNTGLSGDAAWGYKQMLNCPVNNPLMQSRHLNLGRQKDGTVLVNAFQIFDFKPYDKLYQINVRDEAIRRIKQDVIPYMRANLKGFEKAEFVSAAPEFYIRETRHMMGEQTLTANDVFDSVFPNNYIAVGSYPIDIQANRKGDIGTILTGTKPYGVPAGAIIPKGVEGIYVPSKAASFDSIAYGSARTVPVLMALGESAGVMAAVSIRDNVSTRNILTDSKTLLNVRTLLYEKGVRLVSYANAHPIDNSYAANEIKFLRGKALITMTYQNEYGLETRANVEKIYTMLTLMENNSPYDVHKYEVLKMLPQQMNYELTLSDMIPVMNYFTRQNLTSLDQYKTAGIIPEHIHRQIMSKAVEMHNPSDPSKPKLEVSLTTEDLYALMGNVIQKTPIRKNI